ncbi:MAG TPA: hypothetical protein VHV32_19425 [Candidatus Angelobacter sp.]|jgi:hypothetical protein|nr:hypothetical protein [Candidatus Angelobacter sp.]
MNWLCSFFNYCWKHRKPMGWDGYVSYVCPECAKTEDYINGIHTYIHNGFI